MNLLEDNVSRFIQSVDKVIIWDNTPEQDSMGFSSFFSNQKIVIKHNGYNAGIAKALNFALDFANLQGYSYILTMDQDSLWENFEEYRNFVLALNPNVYGPIINHQKIKLRLQRCQHIITSGTLVHTDVLNKIGGYFEGFDVDAIDFEMCDRARHFGYNIYQVRCGRLIQRFGEQKYISFGSKKISKLNYSEKRIFNNSMGLVILARAYRQPPFYCIRLFFKMYVVNVIKLLIVEDNAFLKIKALFAGAIAGLHYNINFLERRRL